MGSMKELAAKYKPQQVDVGGGGGNKWLTVVTDKSKKALDAGAKVGQLWCDNTAFDDLTITPLGVRTYFSLQPSALRTRCTSQHRQVLRKVGLEDAFDRMSDSDKIEIAQLPVTGGPPALDAFREKPDPKAQTLGIRTIEMRVYVHDIEAEAIVRFKGMSYIPGSDLVRTWSNDLPLASEGEQEGDYVTAAADVLPESADEQPAPCFRRFVMKAKKVESTYGDQQVPCFEYIGPETEYATAEKMLTAANKEGADAEAFQKKLLASVQNFAGALPEPEAVRDVSDDEDDDTPF